MKFTDGKWVNNKNYDVQHAVQPYDIIPTENGLNIYATTKYIRDRGMTIGGPCIEIRICSKQKNVFHISADHFRGTYQNKPAFEINEDQDYRPIVNEKTDTWEIISGETKAIISKDEWSVEYFYAEKRLTGAKGQGLSYILEDEHSTESRLDYYKHENFWSYLRDARSSFMREQLTMNVGDCFYGFGEKFTPFVKNGQSIEIWNSDGGTSTDQSYKPIPFYICSSGYGVLVNTSDRVSFEVCSDRVSEVSFTVPGEHIDYYIIGGTDIPEVISNYTSLTGKPGLPPAYSFGLWLTTSFTTDYDEKTVSSFIDGMEERDIPLQVFHFDCFWMKDFSWCNFEWDKRQFSDPEKMLKRLKKDNRLKICVWINPYIAQRSKLFDEGMANGYFIKRPDGSIFQTDFWQPGMAIVDFTNPKACEWYASKLRKLCKMGVDCFKTDFAERLPVDAVYYSGNDPFSMHNYYTYLYNKTVYNVLKDFHGENKVCLFARSATVGGQKYPVHWGGDCTADYLSMAETIRGGLSLCMSGFGFFSHDISGFSDTATPDLYKRWTAFGLLSTHSRLHGSSSYRVPWLFDKDGSTECVDVLRHFTKLKGRLMPYIWAQANKTHQSGIPVMRAMIIDYADDPVCLSLDKQYMFGENILVSPILNDTGTAEFYLPSGTWTDIISGDIFEGGKFYKKQYDYFGLPCLAKNDSIIAYGAFVHDFDYDYLDNAEFVIYEPSEGKEISADIYDSDSTKIFSITAKRQADSVKVSYSGTDKCFSVKVSGHKPVRVAPGGPGQIILKI